MCAAQDALTSALREEVARLNARLTAEGGPSRLPPALITASSLFRAAAEGAEAARARSGALEAELAASRAAEARAAEQLRLFELLTALRVSSGGGAVGGLHAVATTDPSSGAEVTFTLEFFEGEGGAACVEFVPGSNAALLPPFMAVRVLGGGMGPAALSLTRARKAPPPLTHNPSTHAHTHTHGTRRAPSPLAWISAPCSLQR